MRERRKSIWIRILFWKPITLSIEFDNSSMPYFKSATCFLIFLLSLWMFTTTSVYFIILFLILWCYCGYLIFLLTLAKLQSTEKQKQLPLSHFLKVIIFVPCFNEENQLANTIKALPKKIGNCLSKFWCKACYVNCR